MVANLRPSEQLNFVGLLYCMGQGDGGGAADHVLSFSHQQTCVGPQEVAAFRSAMAALFAESCRGYGTGIDLARVLRGVLGLVRRCAHNCSCVLKGGVVKACTVHLRVLRGRCVGTLHEP
jgi:aarF domain-containing kinase